LVKDAHSPKQTIETNSNLSGKLYLVHSYIGHRILPRNPGYETGVTIALTPVSYPVEPGIAHTRTVLFPFILRIPHSTTRRFG
jgi:hypothetical protein